MTAGEWVLAAAPAAMLPILAWIARRQFGSWLAPSAVFGLFWGAGLLLPLVLAPDFRMWPPAPWLILVLALTLHLGVMAGVALGGRSGHADAARPSGFRLRAAPALIVLTLLGGVGAAVVLISRIGFSWRILYQQPALIIEIGRQWAGLRYGMMQNPPTIVSAFTGVLFGSGWLAGLWIAVERSKRAVIIGSLPLVFSLLQSFLVSARTGFIWLCIFMASPYLASLVLRHARTRSVSPRRILEGALIVVGFVAFYALMQQLREGGGAQRETTLLKTRVATLSPPMSFSHWLRDNWTAIRPAWGEQTFAGVFDWLGMARRGRAAGASQWEEDLEIETTPNVYTGFRQLIEDATVPGAIVVFAVLGLVVGLAYQGVRAARIGWLPVLAGYYGVTLGSYLSLWTTYNSCLLGWALFALAVGRFGPRLLTPVAGDGAPAAAGFGEGAAAVAAGSPGEDSAR